MAKILKLLPETTISFLPVLGFRDQNIDNNEQAYLDSGQYFVNQSDSDVFLSHLLDLKHTHRCWLIADISNFVSNH